MAEFISVKVKKALTHLFNCLHSLPCIPYKTFFKIFDSKVSCILLYGAELWGLTSHRFTEQVQIYACKRVLGANQTACNDAMLADRGRFPMFIYSAGRSIEFWLRILSLPNDRYLKLCYNMFCFIIIILVVQTGWHTFENIYMRMVMVIFGSNRTSHNLYCF